MFEMIEIGWLFVLVRWNMRRVYPDKDDDMETIMKNHQFRILCLY